MTDEVSLFIDLENITSSMWNQYQQEIDPLALIEKARKYGLVSFARAYGDFSQPHLQRLENRLRVAGIEPFNCPAKQYGERVQSTVDGNVIMDLFEVVLDRPTVSIVLLMAGDRDYLRVVTRLRNRLGKRVVISGVPGTVSRDLVLAAGAEDPLEPATSEFDRTKVIRLIDAYEKSRHEGVLPIFSGVAQYLKYPGNAQAVNPLIVDRVLSDMVGQEMLVQEEVTTAEGKVVRTTRLDRDHPDVQAALADGAG